MIAPLRWILRLVGLGAAALGVSWVVTMPGDDLRGTWETRGYGLQFDIGRAVIDIYEVTEVSCHHARRIPAHTWLIKATQGIAFASEGGQLQIAADGTLPAIRADRIGGLSNLCPQTPAAPGSARENFDVLWQAMADHYANFDLHPVDWVARRDGLRPTAQTVLDDAALFALFQTTLAGLDDGHLSIRRSDGAIFSPAQRPDWFNDRHLVRDNTLAQVPELTAIANTGLLYGWAAPGVGYVYLSHMRTTGGFNIKSTDIAANGFAQIALAFAAADGIILDLRYNPGGSDEVALAYGSYFTDTAQEVFTKSTRTQNGYSPPHQVSLKPQGSYHLQQPTVVLTSGFTSGAAEALALGLRALPQVTLMGQPTAGTLSDVVSFTLPNGWQLGLSHQRYFAPDGRVITGQGVRPDVTLPVDVSSARAGQDSALEAAIGRLTDP